MKHCYLVLIFISIGMTTTFYAQELCSGNLGENIFTQGDFGSGSTNVVQFDPRIAPGYNYDASPAPDDGFYTITNNTGNWSFIYSAWLRIPDNSNDPNGYMMVVNASHSPGLFYEELVTGLCENTVYQFSADIINIVRTGVENHTLPNVSFLLDDVDLFSTGDILQNEQWQQYGFTFVTSPGQTEITLSLRNNAPGGSGNDLALDNISFQACGSDSFLNADRTIFLCEDDNTPIKLEADIQEDNQAILWQTSSDSITWTEIPDIKEEFYFHEDFSVGKYYYRFLRAGSETELQNVKCRLFSDVILIEVLPLSYIVFDTICKNEILEFGDQELEEGGEYFNAFISSRGCDSLVDLNLFIIEPEDYEVAIELNDPNCFNSSDGIINGNLINGQFGPYSFKLNNETLPEINFRSLIADTYLLEVADKHNCTQTFEYTLIDPLLLEIALPSDTTISLGQSLDIELEVNQAVISTKWSPSDLQSCDNCLEFKYQPPDTHTLIVEAINDKGCFDLDTMNVTIDKSDINIYIPNVFSPSEFDNQSFRIGAIPGLIESVINFKVYDRWGGIIHEVSNTSDLELWRNPQVSSGIYAYKLELILLDGNTFFFQGEVLLLN